MSERMERLHRQDFATWMLIQILENLVDAIDRNTEAIYNTGAVQPKEGDQS